MAVLVEGVQDNLRQWSALLREDQMKRGFGRLARPEHALQNIQRLRSLMPKLIDGGQKFRLPTGLQNGTAAGDDLVEIQDAALLNRLRHCEARMSRFKEGQRDRNRRRKPNDMFR